MRAVIEAQRGLGSIAVSLRALPDMSLLDIWCERQMLRLNISSMTLTVQREFKVKRSIARGLANFDVAGQLVGSTVVRCGNWRARRSTDRTASCL